jgi:hypothetical protein
MYVWSFHAQTRCGDLDRALECWRYAVARMNSTRIVLLNLGHNEREANIIDSCYRAPACRPSEQRAAVPIAATQGPVLATPASPNNGI